MSASRLQHLHRSLHCHPSRTLHLVLQVLREVQGREQIEALYPATHATCAPRKWDHTVQISHQDNLFV